MTKPVFDLVEFIEKSFDKKLSPGHKVILANSGRERLTPLLSEKSIRGLPVSAIILDDANFFSDVGLKTLGALVPPVVVKDLQISYHTEVPVELRYKKILALVAVTKMKVRV